MSHFLLTPRPYSVVSAAATATAALRASPTSLTCTNTFHQNRLNCTPVNEPNMGWDQAHLYPAEAAQLWKQWVEPVATARGLRLGAPVAANCGGSGCITNDPFVW